MIERLGLQLYTVSAYMSTPKDVRETFKKLRDLGYDNVQTAGCQIPYDEFGQIAKEEGLEICGTHDDFDVMVKDPAEAIKRHQLLNTKLMGIGGFSAHTPEEAEEFIGKANKVAAYAKDYGFKFTYHNHSDEFVKYDNGKRLMDMLVEGLDPVNTSFVLDTYWVQHGGGDVKWWINKLAGRIDILHLKDMLKRRYPESQEITYIGNGNLDWDGIIEAADKAGVKYYVVEQDNAGQYDDAFECVKRSAQFLKQYMK